jgi:RNA polymerase sigma factor (sigma-70 family)
MQLTLTVTAKAKFTSAIQAVLNPHYLTGEERTSYAGLKNYIKRTLQQFNLQNRELDDVLNEVYIRGIKYIELGQEIEKPRAWIRKTCFNVIREISRRQRRNQPTDPRSIESQIEKQQFSNNWALEDKEVDVDLLKLSLEQLNPKDHQLLVLREVEDLSWKEVVEHLAAQGIIVNEATARQRGKRALERLRQIYGALSKSN